MSGALFALIVLVPLAWTKLFMAEFTLAKLLVLNAALAAGAVAAAAVPRALAAGPTALDFPLAAGLCVALISAALSDDPATSLRGRYDSYAYGAWGLALASASAQLAARGARGREEAPFRWLVWSGAAVGGYAILQKFGVDPVFRLKELPAGGRAVSTLGSPVDLGAMLALLWPAALRRFDDERGAHSALLAACVAGGLLASGARGAMLAAAAGTAAYWLLSRREPARSFPLALGVSVAAAAGALGWSARAGSSVSDLARLEVWKTAFAAFKLRPWLGWGPDGFEDAFKLLRTREFVELMGPGRYQAYAHNDALHVLAGVGLIGAAVYAWLQYASCLAAKDSLAQAAGRRRAAALFAGLLALWVNTALNPVALEVLVLAAVCSGLLASSAAANEARPPARPLLLVFAALTAVSLIYSARLARADAAFKRGVRAQAEGRFPAARAELARARAGSPCEMAYITAELNAVSDWINATRVVGERLELLALADADAKAALVCHPRQALAHYAAANAASMRVELGFRDRLSDALASFDRAIELDPKLEALRSARAATARFAATPR